MFEYPPQNLHLGGVQPGASEQATQPGERLARVVRVEKTGFA